MTCTDVALWYGSVSVWAMRHRRQCEPACQCCTLDQLPSMWNAVCCVEYLCFKFESLGHARGGWESLGVGTCDNVIRCLHTTK